jgi:hypothetical protein
VNLPILGPGQCYVSDADYRRYFAEQIPEEPCPDCGQPMECGAERCQACERKKHEFDVNANDPRRW